MRRLGLALLFLFAFASTTAFAQKPKPAPPAPPPVAAPARPGAIAYLAGELAAALGNVPAGTLVAASPVASDIPAPKGDELALRIATQLAGKIGGRAHPQPATLAVARGASGRAASLAYVQLEIAKGELRATADLYPVVSNGWERLRNPAPGPKAHGFAGAALDAEVRTFLQPIVLEQATLHKAKHEETDVLAVGCGDADVDGGLELVVASRTRVVVGKLQGGKLVVMRTMPWSQLASRAPVPLREPLASIVVSPRDHRGEVFLGTTDRGGVATDAALVTKRTLAGLPIPGAEGEACAMPHPESNGLDGPGVACALPPKGDPPPVLPLPSSRYDVAASLDVVGKDGALTHVVATREAGGKLRLRREPGKPAEATAEAVGAQLALADLDLDGYPELVFGSDAADLDALAVWTWRPNGLVQRMKFPTKEPVRAVATCPAEERGLPAAVAVVGSEVWLLR